MSGSVATEGVRPRPLSGGLWTLFSWLRREERSSSEDSLSSAGSDRTAASFAFLQPALYPAATARSLQPREPTDSYRRRVHEGLLRRQRDADLTLHRKYGLYGLGYEVQSLPSAARRTTPRLARAASESPREHVPGKRRAPPPPDRALSLARTARRKRPAPPPPARLAPLHERKADEDADPGDGAPMSGSPPRDSRPSDRVAAADDATGCKPEKYSKRDARTKDTKEVKLRHEKSFLKQIFDGRKRNSAVDTASVKLLPNISELDKQAAEMIEKYRLKEMARDDTADVEAENREAPGSSKHQMEAWICTICLRKYNATVITCNYCLPLNKADEFRRRSKVSNHGTQTNDASGSRNKAEDKEKLKEMLKEMKDSLPKRPKNDNVFLSKPKNPIAIYDYPTVAEAATLRIGSSIPKEQTTPKEQPTPEEPAAQSLNIKASSSQASERETKENDKIFTSTCANGLESASNKLASHDIHRESKDLNNMPISSSGNISGPVSLSGNSIVQASTSNTVSIENKKELPSLNSVFITQPVVLLHTKESNVVVNTPFIKEDLVKLIDKNNVANHAITGSKNINKVDQTQNTEAKSANIKVKSNHDLNTPLKISSLLNPIYIPKSAAVNKQTSAQQTDNVKTHKTANTVPLTQILPDTKTPGQSVQIILGTSSNSHTKEIKPSKSEEKKVVNGLAKTTEVNNLEKKVENDKVAIALPSCQDRPKENIKVSQDKPKDNTKVSKDKPTVNISQDKPTEDNIIKVDKRLSQDISLDQHTRKRELITQLEQSIAKGDEQAAAEAAVKLAQLRLACSVLSFSSQIVGEASTSAATPLIKASSPVKEIKQKVEDNKQNSAQTKTEHANAKEIKEPAVVTTNNKVASQPTAKKITNVTKIETEKILPPAEPLNKLNDEVKNNNVQPLNKPNDKVKNNNVQSIKSEASTSKGVTKNENDNENVPILVWVEDKEATRGPVQLHVRRDAVMGDLRRQAEQSLGLAAGMQRWIVGRALCTDDNTRLVALAGAELTAPFYLCLVESDSKETPKLKLDVKLNDEVGNVYNELVKLEHQAIVTNTETFECGVCIEECPPGAGVVLRECVHSFCKECVTDVVRHSEEAVVACPAMGCRGNLQEREIRGLVSPGDYEKWLARGLAAAESGTRNAFHCRTRDCTGWALCEPGVRKFPCPVCKHTNCVPCQAIHEKETCEQHRAKLQQAANSSDTANSTDEGTRALLDTLISRGEALECPECRAIITKKWGCDWVKCSACKTEICWVTKGRRWGPAGRGDTSAGCKCGVDGKRCHPSCGYCH